MSARKLSSVSRAEMAILDEELERVYTHYQDEEGDFEEDCLITLCRQNDLISSKLTEADVTMIFQAVRVGKKANIKFPRFQEAIRKINQKLSITYQELVQKIKVSEGDVTSASEVQRRVSIAAAASKKDEYEFIKKLGKGGQGDTALVKHKKSGQQLAAKQIVCGDFSEASQATTEVLMMQKMTGPQFVKFEESFTQS